MILPIAIAGASVAAYQKLQKMTQDEIISRATKLTAVLAVLDAVIHATHDVTKAVTKTNQKPTARGSQSQSHRRYYPPDDDYYYG